MTFAQVCQYMLNELSAGGMSQNLGFYTLLVLLAWVWVVQIKEKPQRFGTN